MGNGTIPEADGQFENAPYLTPVPFRGKRNEPLYVEEVAKKIAAIKNLPLDAVIDQTTENTELFFGLPNGR